MCMPNGERDCFKGFFGMALQQWHQYLFKAALRSWAVFALSALLLGWCQAGQPRLCCKTQNPQWVWNLGPNYSCLKASLAEMLQDWMRYQTALLKGLSCLSLCGWGSWHPVWLQVHHLPQDIQCSVSRAPNILYVSDACRKISPCLYFIAVLLFT